MAAADMIDIGKVTIINSPDVRDWPITATISEIACKLDGVSVKHSKQDGADAWPEITPPNFTGPIQFCFWAFLNREGQWFGSAGLEFWKGRPSSGDPVSGIGHDWFYDNNRWGPIANVAVNPGDVVGFMVTAGEARNYQQQGLRERSNIVTITVPVGNVGVFTFPDSTPAPSEPPPPSSDPAPDWAEQLVMVVDELVNSIQALQVDIRAATAKADDLKTHGIKVHF